VSFSPEFVLRARFLLAMPDFGGLAKKGILNASDSPDGGIRIFAKYSRSYSIHIFVWPPLAAKIVRGANNAHREPNSLSESHCCRHCCVIRQSNRFFSRL
jgi:hypothetical protein